MVQHFHYQSATVPTVFVTKGRQRVKQYNQNVYLRNGDQFELELFNPTNNKVLAKISLNGNSLGSGIILRPGERVFLERYLDDAKKFLFETYEVDGNSSTVKNAIKDNGLVEVEFFDEYYPWRHSSGSTITYTGGTGDWTYYNDNNLQYGGNPNLTNLTGKSIGKGQVTTCYYMSTSTDADLKIGAVEQSAKLIETGRVEKGEHSNQSFTYDSTEFNSWSSWKTTWKILPESQKALVQEDLKVFCTNCGAKRKKASHKFCPNCGAKF
jgi:hypothetical protein